MQVQWEWLEGRSNGGLIEPWLGIWRLATPGGWLVRPERSDAQDERPYPFTFIPDPDHAWGREVKDKPKPTRCALIDHHGNQCRLDKGHVRACDFADDPT